MDRLGEVAAGTVITYTVIVTNNGNTIARNVTVRCEAAGKELPAIGTGGQTNEVSDTVSSSELNIGKSISRSFAYAVPKETSAGTSPDLVMCHVGAAGLGAKIAQPGPRFNVGTSRPVITSVKVTPVQVGVGELITITARVVQDMIPVSPGTEVGIRIGEAVYTDTVKEDGQVRYEHTVLENEVNSSLPITISVHGGEAATAMSDVSPAVAPKVGRNLRSAPRDDPLTVIRLAGPEEIFHVLGKSDDAAEWLWLCCLDNDQTAWLWKQNVDSKIGSYTLVPVVKLSRLGGVVYGSFQGALDASSEDTLVSNLDDGTHLRVIDWLENGVLRVRLNAWLPRNQATIRGSAARATTPTNMLIIPDQSLPDQVQPPLNQAWGPAVAGVEFTVADDLSRDDLIQVVLEGYVRENQLQNP